MRVRSHVYTRFIARSLTGRILSCCLIAGVSMTAFSGCEQPSEESPVLAIVNGHPIAKANSITVGRNYPTPAAPGTNIKAERKNSWMISFPARFSCRRLASRGSVAEVRFGRATPRACLSCHRPARAPAVIAVCAAVGIAAERAVTETGATACGRRSAATSSTSPGRGPGRGQDGARGNAARRGRVAGVDAGRGSVGRPGSRVAPRSARPADTPPAGRRSDQGRRFTASSSRGTALRITGSAGSAGSPNWWVRHRPGSRRTSGRGTAARRLTTRLRCRPSMPRSRAA